MDEERDDPVDERPRLREARDSRSEPQARPRRSRSTLGPGRRETRGGDRGTGIEPEWLRRRLVRGATPLESPPLETSSPATMSARDLAVATLPLIVGLVLLFLGFGPGEVAINP